MGANKIGRAIKENCKGDDVMQGLLMELLEFNRTGKQWYKDEYCRLIEKYAAQMEDDKPNENQENKN